MLFFVLLRISNLVVPKLLNIKELLENSVGCELSTYFQEYKSINTHFVVSTCL